MPTEALLGFTLDHARARDAVHAAFDHAGLVAGLSGLGLQPVQLSSQARDRGDYLRRPDLGRMLDPASRTSAALTRILLKRVYGLTPEYRDGGADTDARLVIGDPALKTRLNGHVVLDLAALWRAFSGHPFVFAFWAIPVAVFVRVTVTPGTAALEVSRV